MMKVVSLTVGVMAATARAGAAAPLADFGSDVAFLQQHTEIILLQRGDAQVAVAPAYQGRVMTSTTGGGSGPSFGWINRPVIAAGLLDEKQRQGKLEEHIYVFGGEERLWLGPEGGQFSIFFAPGSKFEFDVWHTPALIDTEPFDILKKDEASASFGKDFDLVNWSGARLKGRLERTVRLLNTEETSRAFGFPAGGELKVVAYETINRLTNQGEAPWTKETGALSIWMLGMYNPSPATTVVIPFKPGAEAELGPKVNDAYFGKVPPDYLEVKDKVLFFRGDGTRRGKIGLSPQRSLGIAGSYAADSKTLNLVAYDLPEKHDGYVNSMWELQKNPFNGDALNSYNDGSPGPGKAPLGPFYELETSSPAAFLAPGATMTHVQRTVHIQGPEDKLDKIAMDKLGAGLDDIQHAFLNKD